jgi:uncharacterized iron-regulated membrane protein
MASQRPLWPKVGSAFVRDQLIGHKLLGLALAALMYVICLSGTVAVFYREFERWEKPAVPEMSQASPEAVARVVADARTRMAATKSKDTLYVGLPSPDMPRLTASWGVTGRAYDAQGRYAGPADHPVTHFVTELHYYLHLPSTIGFFIVGVAGAGLLALIVGGLLSHPRILKDAFHLRLRGAKRLGLTDLHNRLGVWAAPFHFVIALTGAMIGLGQVLFFLMALMFYKGDLTKAFEPLLGSPAEFAAATGGKPLSGDAAVLRALGEIKAKVPDATPNGVVLYGLGTPQSRLEISANMVNRVIYSENFRFDADGYLKSRAGLSDGPVGKQIYSSLYPLHFGSFGGLAIELVYVVLGLGLCLICATGTDLWLMKSAEKGKPHPALHRMWTAFIWVTPAALAVSAAAMLALGWPARPIFWGLLLVAPLAAISPLVDQKSWSKAGRLALGLSLILLPAAHVATFRSVSIAALGPNLVFAFLGVAITAVMLFDAMRTRRA